MTVASISSRGSTVNSVASNVTPAGTGVPVSVGSQPAAVDGLDTGAVPDGAHAANIKATPVTINGLQGMDNEAIVEMADTIVGDV